MLREERQFIKKIADGLTLDLKVRALPLERRFSFYLHPSGREVLSLNVTEIKRLPKFLRQNFNGSSPSYLMKPGWDGAASAELVLWARHRLGRKN